MINYTTVKAVIFDLDGVLVDTAIYHFQAWHRLAEDLGYSFSIVDNEQLKGVSRIESLELILKWAGVEKSEAEKADLLVLKNQWYLELIEQLSPDHLLSGSLELLKKLQEKGIKIGLGSASKNAMGILEKTGIIPYFDALIDGNVVQLSKPNPEVFLKGAKVLEIVPAHCLVLEDAQAGIDAARAAGMQVIGVGLEEHLKGADLVVADLGTLVDKF
ncbi:beta-phosphoglucomutase [Sphingobacterium paramultivorum]|uniref:Beta-phosphoglucomutase n=1 Tax=Sphingobacterium paramultivorum TaxID=2886510 RepID=A0A7G5E3Q0_9SPHI|nr:MULTISPECIES: beta-phosphoglucomutase [Sphingobacterium]MCS4167786.1 beta-phosphoglucomutase [Sphingobacterium sp. BIGb0116]QMV68625.1 beta-phosphoglucomutase [Sphingobacterium paramultivorum]WSO17573.1 beta-phosphoglucomutase [Sphingobacterium paramultivorum]